MKHVKRVFSIVLWIEEFDVDEEMQIQLNSRTYQENIKVSERMKEITLILKE